MGGIIAAQENIVLQGIVETDTVETSQINILNPSKKTGTTSNADGTFEISVRENDTIIFSAVQFQILKVKITREILQNKILKVKLKTLVNELEEVRISDINLSGNLKYDLANIKVFKQANVGFPLKDYQRPTGLGKIKASYYSSPLMLIINTINGNIKRLERAEEVIRFDKLVDKGINAVSVSFFIEKLLIPEDEIFKFVNYCAQNDTFEKIVTEGPVLELIDLFYREAPLFKQRISH